MYENLFKQRTSILNVDVGIQCLWEYRVNNQLILIPNFVVKFKYTWLHLFYSMIHIHTGLSMLSLRSNYVGKVPFHFNLQPKNQYTNTCIITYAIYYTARNQNIHILYQIEGITMENTHMNQTKLNQTNKKVNRRKWKKRNNRICYTRTNKTTLLVFQLILTWTWHIIIIGRCACIAYMSSVQCMYFALIICIEIHSTINL